MKLKKKKKTGGAGKSQAYLFLPKAKVQTFILLQVQRV